MEAAVARRFSPTSSSCGVCNGNNSCLDCKGVPYGSTVLDICGICGRRNDPQQGLGCDGKVSPAPAGEI